MAEHIDEVGYINEEHKHVLIGFREPALLNPSSPPEKWVQVAVTIESAMVLRDALTEFLAKHNQTLN